MLWLATAVIEFSPDTIVIIVAVMAGLVPAIHVFVSASKTWMPATSAGMTR